jgi:hypothetical protein
MIAMNQLGIAIWAFHPTFVRWDLQPNAGMSQGTFAAVTGNAIGFHDTGFRSLH